MRERGRALGAPKWSGRPRDSVVPERRGGGHERASHREHRGQERAPTNINDAIPREYLERFEAAGLIEEARRELLGLDIEPSE